MGLPYSLAPKHKFACQNLIQGRTFGEVSRIGWGSAPPPNLLRGKSRQRYQPAAVTKEAKL
ncbi:hypothetical protein GCM10011497_37640 [Elstera cyanobacteriorum]|nr:hypothetical protein GCM10011497_37640 [Elstera cyanobacteriorum]